MKKVKQIEIDLEVYKALVQHCNFIDEPFNDVLKRVLGKYEGKEDEDIEADQKEGGLLVKRTFLKNGMKLQKNFKGKLFEAIVRNGYIEFEDKKYTSPSGPAVVAAQGSVNGWRFWDFFDEKDNQWKLLETLRK